MVWYVAETKHELFLCDSPLVHYLSFLTRNNPKVVLGVEKDGGSGLHWAYLQKQSPLVNLPLLVDLNGNLVWLNCDQLPHSINNTLKSPFNAPAPTPSSACSLPSLNPVTLQSAMSHLAQDHFQAPLIDLLFACAPSSLLQKGLPKNVQGVVGLGHNDARSPCASLPLPNHRALYSSDTNTISNLRIYICPSGSLNKDTTTFKPPPSK